MYTRVWRGGCDSFTNDTFQYFWAVGGSQWMEFIKELVHVWVYAELQRGLLELTFTVCDSVWSAGAKQRGWAYLPPCSVCIKWLLFLTVYQWGIFASAFTHQPPHMCARLVHEVNKIWIFGPDTNALMDACALASYCILYWEYLNRPITHCLKTNASASANLAIETKRQLMIINYCVFSKEAAYLQIILKF